MGESLDLKAEDASKDALKHRGKPLRFKYLFSSISKYWGLRPLSSGLIASYCLLPTPYSRTFGAWSVLETWKNF